MPVPAVAPVAPLSPQAPLLGRSLAELEAWAVAKGQPACRGRQLHDWIYAKAARSLEAISVLPKAWRQRLLAQAGPALIGRLPLLHRSDAADGTVKLLLGTADGLSIETVGIPSGDRLTVCVSSQVGCPMACRFC
ncbi:MAG: 23S rRNA (adenine(2503)-C(2))-methyltransferase RlmN, partial [Cyanobium sp.]